jgi:hypothetical protein
MISIRSYILTFDYRILTFDYTTKESVHNLKISIYLVNSNLYLAITKTNIYPKLLVVVDINQSIATNFKTF